MVKFQMVLRTSLSLLLLLFISCGDSNRATQSVLPTPVVTYTPGEIVSDLGGHIQYYVGNTPIIITVPHDGDIMPPSISDRTGETKKAENTLGIAEYFYNTFTSNGANGLYPHIIINNVNRSRLDPDASIEIGAQSNNAVTYFNRYHTYIQAAVDSTEAKFRKVILVNLSAQKDYNNEGVESGVLLRKKE